MIPLRFVLDTNVALDLLHWNSQLVAPLRPWLADGQAVWLTNDACGAEFERVLGYPEFKLLPAGRLALGAEYARLTQRLSNAESDPPARLPRCRDADDQKFLELAVACRADVLLTRDKALLRLARSIRLVAPQLTIATPLAHLPKILVSDLENC